MDGLLTSWLKTYEAKIVDILFYPIFYFWYYLIYGTYLLVDLLLFKTMIMPCFIELVILDHIYLGGLGMPSFFVFVFSILIIPLIPLDLDELDFKIND